MRIKNTRGKTHIDPPGISGNLVEGRFYYDLFVYGHKADGVYVDVTTGGSVTVLAAPTIAKAGGAITAAEGATAYYTTDGTDPRYSLTAKAGTAPTGGNNGNIWVHWSAYPNNYEFNKNENGKLIARGGYGDTQLKIISGGYNVSGYSMLHVVGNYELNIANYGEDWFGLSSVANDYNPNICNQYMKIGDTAKSFHLQIPFSFNGTASPVGWRPTEKSL